MYIVFSTFSFDGEDWDDIGYSDPVNANSPEEAVIIHENNMANFCNYKPQFTAVFNPEMKLVCHKGHLESVGL